MLKDIDITMERLDSFPIEAQASIAYYKARLKSGKQLDFKLKITKKHKYINIYEYDNKRWKYILVDSVEI